MILIFFSFATIVVDLELLEYNIPVEDHDGEGHQAAASDFGGWRSAMDKMDEGNGKHLDGEKCGHNNRPRGHRKRMVSTVFFVLFSNSFLLLLLHNILPFLLLI